MATFIQGSEREIKNSILRDYRISPTRIITLKLNEEWDRITFSENDIEFKDSEFEFKDFDGTQTTYLLARMYAPIKKAGLGQAALLFFKHITGATVWARKLHDEPNDGSHLTGDAPNFVNRMMDKSILRDDRNS